MAGVQVNGDEPGRNITVNGTADQVALATWLVAQLDTKTPPVPSVRYTMKGGPDDSVRVFYMAHMPAQFELNEFVTTLRAVGDIQKIFAYTPLNAVGLRTTSAKAQLADWLDAQLDTEKPAASPARYAIGGNADDVVRVLFLAHAPFPAALNEVVSTVRTIGDITHIFTSSQLNVIVFRSTSAQAKLAEWLVKQVDQPPDSHPTMQRYPFAQKECSDGLVEVAFLPEPLPNAGLNQIVTRMRSGADLRYIFSHSLAPQAIAFRGCPAQVETADRLFAQN